MPLTEKVLHKQVGRLKDLPRQEGQFWGDSKTPGLRDELLRSLWKIATDDDHARQIIDRVMDTKPNPGKDGNVVQFCPTPGALAATAELIARDRERVRGAEKLQPTQCSECGDTGWKRKVRTIDGREYDFAVPCNHGHTSAELARAGV